MRKLMLLLIVLLITVSLLGCGGAKINQSSMENTAKTFVQALIDGDEEVLNQVSE